MMSLWNRRTVRKEERQKRGERERERERERREREREEREREGERRGQRGSAFSFPHDGQTPTTHLDAEDSSHSDFFMSINQTLKRWAIRLFVFTSFLTTLQRAGTENVWSGNHFISIFLGNSMFHFLDFFWWYNMLLEQKKTSFKWWYVWQPPFFHVSFHPRFFFLSLLPFFLAPIQTQTRKEGKEGLEIGESHKRNGEDGEKGRKGRERGSWRNFSFSLSLSFSWIFWESSSWILPPIL